MTPFNLKEYNKTILIAWRVYEESVSLLNRTPNTILSSCNSCESCPTITIIESICFWVIDRYTQLRNQVTKIKSNYVKAGEGTVRNFIMQTNFKYIQMLLKENLLWSMILHPFQVGNSERDPLRDALVKVMF